MNTKPWTDIKATSKPDVVARGEARAQELLATMRHTVLEDMVDDYAGPRLDNQRHDTERVAERLIRRRRVRRIVREALTAFVAGVKAREFYDGGIDDEEAGGYKAALAVMDEELAKWLAD